MAFSPTAIVGNRGSDDGDSFSDRSIMQHLSNVSGVTSMPKFIAIQKSEIKFCSIKLIMNMITFSSGQLSEQFLQSKESVVSFRFQIRMWRQNVHRQSFSHSHIRSYRQIPIPAGKQLWKNSWKGDFTTRTGLEFSCVKHVYGWCFIDGYLTRKSWKKY